MNKQDILDKIDIVDVVSEYVELERKGKNYFGVCPFHNDNNPSMSVSPQKQLYKCFSCGAGGDAITFVKDIENISFKEALKSLASSVGIEYDSSSEYIQIKDSYYNIYLDSTKYFTYNLHHTKEGSKYLQYLLDRNFSLETIEEFGIGSSNNDLVKLLFSKYKSDEIIKTGIVNNNNNLIFNSRIIFPITDYHGNVIAYSGRVINDATPKYLNTPETKYFKKSDTLYNIHLAKSEIEKTKSVIITEGFFDVMRLHCNGYKNAIATMGTAFTASHVRTINSLAESVYLCMDSDAAGIKASEVIYNMLKSDRLKIYMIDLSDLDPDEFILKFGIDKFNVCLKSAKLYEEYFVDKLLNQFLNMSISQKEEVIAEVKKFVNSISNQVTKKLISDYVYEKTGFSIANFTSYSKPREISRQVDNKSVVESYYNFTVAEEDVINKIEQEFLFLMLNSKFAIELYENEVNSLNVFQNEEVAMIIKQFYIQNSYDDILEYFINSYSDYNDNQIEVILNILKSLSSINLKCDETTIRDYVERIVVFKYEKRIEAVSKKLMNESDNSNKLKLLKKLNILVKEKTDIIERRGM